MPPTPQQLREIEADLKAELSGEVRFTPGDRAMYATDASNYRMVPYGVVLPRSIDDVIAAVSIASLHGIPILSRGGGTSLAGQCCNEALVLDMSKYMGNDIRLDLDARTATVSPGVVLDDLRRAAKRHGLTFGPDPATHGQCTIGGMIGNNSCGVHSLMSGRTSDNVLYLDVLTYDGLRMSVGPTSATDVENIIRAGGRRAEIYSGMRTIAHDLQDEIRQRYPKIPRRVSGYNLDELLTPEMNVARVLTGSEGTLVTVLEATVTLIEDPPAKSLVVFGLPDVVASAELVPEILEHGPIGLEGIDETLVDFMKREHLRGQNIGDLPVGAAWLLVELGGESKRESDRKAKALIQALKRNHPYVNAKLFENEVETTRLWRLREAGLGATAFVPGERASWPGWEDAAVHPDQLADYLRAFKELLRRSPYKAAAIYGHFGDGCVHCRIDFDLGEGRGVQEFRAFVEESADLVVSFGGSLSGEHGDGQARAELLERMYGPRIVEGFRRLKHLWDPQKMMNPGKVVDPLPLDSNLRLANAVQLWEPQTHFKFPRDEGRLSSALMRCVGIGACRQEDGATMCPSYVVTKEERHTTRGRARLLFEMLQGEEISDGWKSQDVKEALDLCLSCKGCKSDCPVSVDMSTYKAEFLSHYYERRVRPRQAYSLGMVHRWLRLAALAPGAANAVMSSALSQGLKRLAGVASQREVPRLAPATFRRSFKSMPLPRTGKRVILWVDTFNDHFEPEVLRSAVHVLTAAGWGVAIPEGHLCCGRPLYEFGMLRAAKRSLLHVMEAMDAEIATGIPIVGLEPSCVSVFRDELLELLPDHPLARSLSQQVYTLGEFLERHASDVNIPSVDVGVVAHAHCHQKSVLNASADLRLLHQAAKRVSFPDEGCCGMAGAFGFDEAKYSYSMAIAERKLLPAIRSADVSTVVVSDGFSCREQIRQGAGVAAMHTAQLLSMALNRQDSNGLG